MKATILVLASLVFVHSSFAKQLDVQGHRGARAVLPENSIAAFQHALELGVDTLEFDMGVSKDGVVVIAHDQQINPIICQYKNGKEVSQGILIHQLTLAQIKEFDCGSKKNPRFEKQQLVPGSEIPTLDEVFKLVANSTLPNAKTVLFNIETKSDPNSPDAQPLPEEFVRAVLEVVDKYDLQSRVTLQSFDHRTLVAAKTMAPDLQLAALFRIKPDNWLSAAEAAKADIISPYYELIDQEDVKLIQDAELLVIPWTANNMEQWKKLVEIGVDGIITDDPEPLLEFLGRR